MGVFDVFKRNENLKDENDEFCKLIRAFDDGESWAEQKMDKLWKENDPSLLDRIDYARIKIYQEAAYNGDKQAQYWLGVSLRGKDNKESLRLLSELANCGDILAMKAIASGFSQFGGYSDDENKWLEWMLMAAEAGDADAQALVGLHYRNKYEIEKAIEWYERAAEQNCSAGYYGLAESVLIQRVVLNLSDHDKYKNLGNFAEDCYIYAIQNADTDVEVAQASFGVASYYNREAQLSRDEWERQDLFKRSVYFYYQAYINGNPYGWKNMQEVMSMNGICIYSQDIDEWARKEGIISD